MKPSTKLKYGDKERSPLIKIVPKEAKRILDIGCNQGAFGGSLKALEQREVWGVEPNKDAAVIAKTRLDHVIIDYFHKEIAVPNHYFDLITFNDTLEHMVDPVDALNICKSKLKKGGRVHCCIPNVRFIDNLEHLIFSKDWRYEDKGIRDRTHLRFYTKKSITRLFQEEEFYVQEIFGINEKWSKKHKLLRKAFFTLFPAFTQDMRYVHFVVIARVDIE